MRRALVLGCAVVLAGCALRARAPGRALPATAEGLLETLAARRAAVTSLRARARVKGISGMWTREAILVRRPDGVRIDVLSPFGLAIALGARDRLLWAYPPSERTRYEGPATPANMTRFLGAPIAVADIVDILLGLPPARRPTAPPDMTLTGDEYRLDIPLADGGQTIWFATDTLQVRRAEERRDGAVALEVIFTDHRDGFPHALEVAAASGARARLAYDTVEPNAAIDAALFEPPPAARVLPLEPP